MNSDWHVTCSIIMFRRGTNYEVQDSFRSGTSAIEGFLHRALRWSFEMVAMSGVHKIARPDPWSSKRARNKDFSQNNRRG
jgi:hypothetical protein